MHRLAPLVPRRQIATRRLRERSVGAGPAGGPDPRRPGPWMLTLAFRKEAEHDSYGLAQTPVQPFVAPRPAEAEQVPHRLVVEPDTQPAHERRHQMSLHRPEQDVGNP